MEMRMLRWSLWLTMKDRIRNEEVRRRAGVVKITVKIRKARMRWLGHVCRREEDQAIRMVHEM